MSITSQNRRDNYVGTNDNNVYDYTFKLFNESHIQVKVRSIVNGVETTLVIDTDYTVQFVNESVGGTVTLVDDGQAWLDGSGYLDADYELSLLLAPTLEQPLDIKNNSKYFPTLHERQFDKLFQILLYQQDQLDRAIKLVSSINKDDFSTDLPEDIFVNGLGKYLRVKSDGTGIELSEGTTADIGSLEDSLGTKEDRTMQILAAPNTVTTLTSSSPRKTIFTEDAGKTADTKLPVATSGGGLNVGRKFTIYNQTDASLDVYASDGVTLIATIDSWYSTTFELQKFTSDPTDTTAWDYFPDYFGGPSISYLDDPDNITQWTPALALASGALSSVVSNGWYSHYGKKLLASDGIITSLDYSFVKLSGYISCSLNTATFTQMIVNNLPVTVSSFFTNVKCQGTARIVSNGVAYNYPIMCEALPGTTNLRIFAMNGQTEVNLAQDIVGTSTQIYFSIEYNVDSGVA
jgi:hypothetical protein